MTDNNVLQFPKHAIIRDTTMQNVERLENMKERGLQNFADALVSEAAEDIAIGLEASGIDIETETFLKDFTLLHIVLTATIYRALEMKHEVHKFVDETVTVAINKAGAEAEDEEEPTLPL